MGALHHGHAALIRYAKTLAGRRGTVVVSIFVNPLQFGPKEDLLSYPRPVKTDRALCRALGVDVLFQPAAEEIIANDASVFVDETGSLSGVLCGASRPGHFRGVCTIVTKLFNIVQPMAAVFGEKDWQQLAIIRRMVKDLDFPVEIFGHPIVREPDGLAVSSRNQYLTPAERALAPQFHAALAAASGKATPAGIIRDARRRLDRIAGTQVDYVEVVDPVSLQAVKRIPERALLAAAITLGKTRLIDNVMVGRISG